MKIWHWIAWNAGRERICDCGIARSETETGARAIAAQCLGGPHMADVETFDVREVTPNGLLDGDGIGQVTS